MAAIVRRLGAASATAAASTTTIYTVPAGKRALLTCLCQSSDGGVGQQDIRINGRSSHIINQQTPNSSRIWPMGTVLQAGESITAHHAGASMYTLLTGVELDARDSATLHRVEFITLNNSSAPANYAPPAGKKFRVREIVICPHGHSNFDVYIYFAAGVPNHGHFIETTVTKPLESLVHHTDMTLPAGESMSAWQSGGASANQGGPMNVHVFISGVLEDA